MQTKILLLLTILAYSIIVSQSFMYIIALKNVQTSLQANSYIELRKLIDIQFNANFKIPMYAGLLGCGLLLISNMKAPGSLLFITAAIAFVALAADTVLALKGNMPINAMINSWPADQYPANWADYRTRWMDIFQYRQFANITGFISLLAGAVFGSK
ncbi:MAG: hypothetical protein IPG38_11095 [Chitinophagaceae bacterium]|nr:hypothetical protein [Chitinophagaceae bacterium]MBK9530239.1 hypothetical protein [Chitinophagaceae bacterium]